MQIRLLRPGLATNRLRLIYLGRILSDGTRLSPWVTSILRRQQLQEASTAASARNSIAGIDFSAIEGAMKSAVQSLEDSNDSSREKDLEAGLSSIDEGKGKGKAKEVDKDRQNNPANGRTIWLHCSVGEAGSIEQEAVQPSTTATPSEVRTGESGEAVSIFAGYGASLMPVLRRGKISTPIAAATGCFRSTDRLRQATRSRL